MSHAEFVEAYRSRRIRVHIDPTAARRDVSMRLLLPWVLLPVIGIGVALALVGWLWTGLSVIAAATLARIAIKSSAPHFVLVRALEDEAFYNEVVETRLLEVRPVL